MSLALSILPVLLAILAGRLTASFGVLPRDRWDEINILSYRILIPAVLIRSIALADLSSLAAPGFVAALLGTLVAAGAAVFGLRAALGGGGGGGLPNPVFTTLFQSTTRWNAFIAIAAMEQFAGPAGIALIALGMAIMIPTINIANVVVLVAYGGARAGAWTIARSIIANPLVIGCLIGLGVNFSGLALPGAALDALDMIGRAALGMGLLAVGAAIAPRRLVRISGRMALGVVLRLAVCPAAFLILAALLRLGPDEALAGAIMFAVPAAANGYVVAQRMGGDADLYADILTWQTFVSMAVLPVAAGAVFAFFGAGGA